MEGAKDDMEEEIERLEQAKANNPYSSLIPAIDHRIGVLRKKLKEFTKSEQD